MKKGVVAILVILALVVLISPGIVGRMAEKSVDEQLQWAAQENKEIKVTTVSFDRGWFSSEGTHRVELGDTGAGITAREAMGLGPDDPSPALIIDTKIDHGLIPVSSVTREEGSLAPGLGRGVSTLSFEGLDGSVTDIPGVVYSELGLDGGLVTHYFLDAGGSGDATWGAGDIKIESDVSAGTIVANGGVDAMGFMTDQGEMNFGTIEVASNMVMTDFGYTVGDVSMSIASIDVASPMSAVQMGPIEITGGSALNGDRVDSNFTMDFAMSGAPPIGDLSWTMDVSLDGVQAEYFGKLVDALESMSGNVDPQMAFASLQDDLMDVFAEGFELRFDQFDVTLPQGTVTSKMGFIFPEMDRDGFVWTGVLMGLEADVDLSIPSELYDMATMMNPQANMAVAMGFLIPDGDAYTMDAEYKQGLLTVNGAPMPIPMPGM